MDSLGRPRRADETPASTPSYHYNSWASNRKKTGQTPARDGDDRDNRRSTGKPADMDDTDGDVAGQMTERDCEQWEAEQARLDRSWYDMEEGGYQEQGSNPFMMNDSKVEELEAKRSKEKMVKAGISQRKAGLNEDRDRWEEGRLISSGVVTQLGNQNTDFDDSTEARTQLMVQNSTGWSSL